MMIIYPILWLVLRVDHLFSFEFNVAVCEEETVIDMFICKVIHQDILNSSCGRDWTRGGVGPKVPCEMISNIQSLSYPSSDQAILTFHQSHQYYYHHHHLVVVSCHRPCLPATSLETTVIPTTQASSFILLYFVCYVWCYKYKLFV